MGSKRERQADRAVLAAYHEARLSELVEHIAVAVDRSRAAHLYAKALLTFPGVSGAECLRQVHVPWTPGQAAGDDSSNAEVLKAVELILEHAEQRPDRSLGVIAMGIRHAERIDAALRNVLRDRADLDDFFDENHRERFFVKNLERVQGDERDAIILTVGYGKGADGQMVTASGRSTKRAASAA